MLDGSGKGSRVVQHLVNDAGDSVEIKDTGKGYRANLAAALKSSP